MFNTRRIIAWLALALLLGGGGSAIGTAQAAPSAIIIGTVRLQGRTVHHGIHVYYDNVDYSRTSPTGQFALAVPNGGTHLIRVKHPGYLSREYLIDDPSGVVTIPETMLRMGDADGDDDVDLTDVVIVTTAYGTRPPSDPRADFNGNGEVDIADLIGMMSNYNVAGPLPWFDPEPPSSGLKWTPRAPLITPRYSLGAAVVDGKVYAVGGLDMTPLATVEMYDPSRDRWTPRTPMPTARFDLAVTAVDGKLYAIGGNGTSGQRLATVEMYDPTTDTWTRRAPMPTARGALGVAALGGKIYAIGGARAGYQALVEVYDPTTDTWTSAAPMPTAREYLGVSAWGDLVYAVGGYNGAPLGVAEAYDPATNTWTTVASLATPRFTLGLGLLEGELYAIGGYGNGASAAVEVYNAAADTWQSRTPLPSARANVAVASLGDRLLVIGGWDGRTRGNVDETRLSTIPAPKAEKRLADFPWHLLPAEVKAKVAEAMR